VAPLGVGVSYFTPVARGVRHVVRSRMGWLVSTGFCPVVDDSF
jgi:hypothetical protein